MSSTKKDMKKDKKDIKRNLPFFAISAVLTGVSIIALILFMLLFNDVSFLFWAIFVPVSVVFSIISLGRYLPENKLKTIGSGILLAVCFAVLVIGLLFVFSH